MLQKGFLRNRYEIQLSKRRFWLSIIIGLGAAFGIYTCFSLFRMVFMKMEFKPVIAPLIFTDEVRYAQNVGFAVLALALGNSVFLGYLFRKPQRSKLPDYKRTAIINDQVFVGFNFLYVCFKFIFLIGLFIAGFCDFNNFPSYLSIFILISLVLFFESYKAILRLFWKKAFKVMWVNLTVLVLLTFLFASTSVFDYKKIEEIMLAQNPPIDLPESSFKSVPNWYHGSIVKLLYENDNVKYQVDGDFMSLEELSAEFRIKKDAFGQYYRRGVIYLLAPKSISMSEIWKVQDALFLAERYHLNYVTALPKPLYTGRFELKGIEKQLSISAYARLLADGMPQPVPTYGWPTAEFIAKQRIIRVQFDEGFVAQGKRLTKKELIPYFKKTIDSKTLFYFKYDEAISFDNYLALYGAYKQALYELRKEDELVKADAYKVYRGVMNWDKYTEEAYYKDQDRLREKYPARYIENYEFESVDRDSEETNN